MTDEDDRRAQQRQRGLDYINSEAGAASAEALGAILEAVEGEWEVKTDGTQAAVDTRADFQSAALTALRNLLFALGALDLLHRRMVAFARNQRMGVISHARDLESLLKPAKLRKAVGQKNMRKMLARVVLDLALLPGASKAVVWALNLAAGGRDPGRSAPRASSTPFRSPGSGPTADSRTRCRSGSRTPRVILRERTARWSPAAYPRPCSPKRSEHSTICDAACGEEDKDTVPIAKPTTVRDWCTRLHSCTVRSRL